MDRKSRGTLKRGTKEARVPQPPQERASGTAVPIHSRGSNLHTVLFRKAAVGPEPGKEAVLQVDDRFSHLLISGEGVVVIDRDFQVFLLRQVAAQFIHSRGEKSTYRMITYSLLCGSRNQDSNEELPSGGDVWGGQLVWVGRSDNSRH